MSDTEAVSQASLGIGIAALIVVVLVAVAMVLILMGVIPFFMPVTFTQGVLTPTVSGLPSVTPNSYSTGSPTPFGMGSPTPFGNGNDNTPATISLNANTLNLTGSLVSANAASFPSIAVDGVANVKALNVGPVIGKQGPAKNAGDVVIGGSVWVGTADAAGTGDVSIGGKVSAQNMYLSGGADGTSQTNFASPLTGILKASAIDVDTLRTNTVMSVGIQNGAYDQVLWYNGNLQAVNVTATGDATNPGTICANGKVGKSCTAGTN